MLVNGDEYRPEAGDIHQQVIDRKDQVGPDQPDLVHQGKPIRIEIVFGLKDESRPTPCAHHILMPRAMSEFQGYVDCGLWPGMDWHAVASKNYPVMVFP